MMCSEAEPRLGGENRVFGFGPILLALCLVAGVGHGQWVEDSIDVGGRWVGSLAYNSRADVVYGGSQSGDLFFTISCDSNKVVSQFYLPWPRYIEYDSIDNKAYCTFLSGGEDFVQVVDGSTHTRIKAIPLNWAIYPVWDPVSNRLYVSCLDEDRVSVIDCRTDSVICHIRVGRDPHKMHLNTRHHKLYVQNGDSESISIVDMETNEVIRTIGVSYVPESGYYNSVVDKYYCGTYGDIVVIDGEADSIIGRIPSSGVVMTIAGSDASNLVMFGVDVYPGSDSVLVVDAVADTVVSALAVGRTPCSLAWSSATNLVYCASGTSNTVSVIAGDGSGVLKTIAVGGCPFVFALAPGSRRLYLGHLNSRMVYVIKDAPGGIAEGGEIITKPASTLRVSPSPFTNSVSIEYAGPEDRRVKASVYSQNGRLVRELDTSPAGQGNTRFVWDGRNEWGRRAPQGVYTVMVRGAYPTHAKLVKLK